MDRSICMSRDICTSTAICRCAGACMCIQPGNRSKTVHTVLRLKVPQFLYSVCLQHGWWAIQQRGCTACSSSNSLESQRNSTGWRVLHQLMSSGGVSPEGRRDSLMVIWHVISQVADFFQLILKQNYCWIMSRHHHQYFPLICWSLDKLCLCWLQSKPARPTEHWLFILGFLTQVVFLFPLQLHSSVTKTKPSLIRSCQQQ